MQTPFEWSPGLWKSALGDGALVRQRVREQTDAVLHIVESIKPKRILDAGSGYGRISLELVERLPNSEIIAVDQSASMLRELVHSKNREHVRVIRGNLERLPLAAGAVDLVLCIGVIMHVKRERTALAEFVRVLGKQGILVLSYHNLLNPFAIIFMSTTLIKKSTGYKQSFHLRRFYESFLAAQGYLVHVRPTPVVPGFAWPPPFEAAFMRLDVCAIGLGYEPILECRSQPPSR